MNHFYLILHWKCANEIPGSGYIVIESDQLGLVEICEAHKKRLTYEHKSLKQKTCGIGECKNWGVSSKKRVSLEASLNIFRKIGQHVPAGAVLCSNHRKEFETSLDHSDKASGQEGGISDHEEVEDAVVGQADESDHETYVWDVQ